uniref:Uncharacterized protein n=1 Tax=Panagrolaimus superbus TaxID=310955 RepID=A0A914ZBP4_9BILA
MSRINASLKRNLNIPNENDVIVKTPYKASRQFGTPLKISNTPQSSLIKPTPKTPGLSLRSNNFFDNAAFTTPIRKPAFEVFEDENDVDETNEKVENKSPDPHLSPVEEDDEPDTCVGHPIYHINDEDFDYLKEVEHVDLYDPSEELFKTIYGDSIVSDIEDFRITFPDSDNEAKCESHEDDFFDFLQYA